MKKNFKLIRKLMIPLLAVSLITGCTTSNNGGGNGGNESQEVIDQNRANEVIAAIDALGENPSEEEVARVRAMYDNLTNVQKRLVTNYDTLVTLENKLAAAKVVALIDALSNSSTQSEVDAAYEAYMELTEEQKAYVTNYDKLEEQMTRLFIEKEIAPTIRLLEALSDSSTEEEVVAAKNAYDSLSEEYKAYIPQELKDKLISLINKYRTAHVDELEAKIAALEPASSSFEECLKLNVKLAAIKADSWYSEISSSAKDRVNELEASTTRYHQVTDLGNAGLSDKKEFLGFEVASTFAHEVDEEYGDIYTIENPSLNSCFTFSSDADISGYDSLFFMLYNPNALTDNVNVWNNDWVNVYSIENVSEGWFTVELDLNLLKANRFSDFNIILELNRVTSAWKVTNAYGYVNTNNVQTVIDLIDALTLITYSSEEVSAINAARAAYNVLTRGGKNLVTNISKLVEFETNVFNYHVSTVVSAIDALTYESHSSQEEEAIAAARALYNALTSEEKTAVTNYSRLEELETAIAEYHHDESVALYQIKLNALVPLNLLSSYIDAMALAKSISDVDAEPESIKNDPILDYSNYNAAVSSLDLFHIVDDGSLTLAKWDYPIAEVGEPLANEVNDTYGKLRVLNVVDEGEHSLSIPKYEGIDEYDSVLLTVYCPVNGGHISIHGAVWAGVSKDLVQGWNEIKVPVSLFESSYPVNAIGIIVNKGAGQWKFGTVFGLEAADPSIIYDGKTSYAGWAYGPINSVTTIDEVEGVVQAFETPDEGEHSFLIPYDSKMNAFTSVTFKVYAPKDGMHIAVHGSVWAGVDTDLVEGWNEITVPVSLFNKGSGYPDNGVGVVYRCATGTVKITAIKGVN